MFCGFDLETHTAISHITGFCLRLLNRTPAATTDNTDALIMCMQMTRVKLSPPRLSGRLCIPVRIVWCAYIAELLLAHDMVNMTPMYAIQNKKKTVNAPLLIEASTATILDAVSDAMSPNDAEMLRSFRLNRDRGGPG